MKRKKITFCLMIFLFVAFTAHAQHYWNGSANRNWNDPNNWDYGLVPDSTDWVILESNSSYYPKLDSNLKLESLTFYQGTSMDVNGHSIIVSGSFDVSTYSTIYNSDSLNSNIILKIGGQSSSSINGALFKDTLIVNKTGSKDLSFNSSTFLKDVIINDSSSTSNYELLLGNGADTIKGNLTVNFISSGDATLFLGGTSIINGNFSFYNPDGGDVKIGNTNADIGAVIGGTISINYDGEDTGKFELLHVINQTAGGGIFLNHVGAFCSIYGDSLKVDSLYTTNYRGNAYGFQVKHCHIIGNVFVSDTSTSDNDLFVEDNLIEGNLSFVQNGIGTLEEAGNHITGNLSIMAHDSGTIYTSELYSSIIEGNYTVTRTGGGYTSLLSGETTIGGNFSYTNLKGGDTYIGSHGINSPSDEGATISGTININYKAVRPGQFKMGQITNLTDGGDIMINGASGDCNMLYDTLMVNSLTFKNFNASDFSALNIKENHILGKVSIADTTTNAGILSIEDNYIGGNFMLTSQSSDDFSATYIDNCIFKGDATINYLSQGEFYLGLFTHSHFYKDANFNLDTVGDVTLYGAIFKGSHNGTIRQTGNRPINFSNVVTINKTGGAKVILADSVGITSALGSVHFINGNIQSGLGKPLIFRSGSDYTGASDNSKVVGPVAEIGHNPFKFPVGTETKYIPIGISSSNNWLPDRFTAQCLGHDPNIDGYNRSAKVASLETINKHCYFRLTRNIGNNPVRVHLGYNLPNGVVTDTAALRVAHWTGNMWQNEGNGGVAGTMTQGLVATNTVLNEFGPFALASSDSTANPLSVPALMDKPLVVIYPNPAQNNLHIKGLHSGEKLRIYNETGRLVKQQVIHSNTTTIPIAKLSPGLYILRVRGKNGENQNLKFIKK